MSLESNRCAVGVFLLTDYCVAVKAECGWCTDLGKLLDRHLFQNFVS